MKPFVPCVLAFLFPALIPTTTQAESIQDIVSIFANDAVASGQTVGAGVAVIKGKAAPQLFTFGNSVVASSTGPGRAFQTNDLFEIASLTKVFTTNLLGQAVHKNQVGLNDPLSSYVTQLGVLKPLTSQVTLKELGDFTGGMVDLAPLCSADAVPGCLPNSRPSIHQYTAEDFATFFRNTVPQDFSTSPPHDATSLPAPYNYSNYGVGLLGLLLASRNAPLSNRDLSRWFDDLQSKVLTPLNMTDTYLDVPANLTSQLAAGYAPALARGQISGGQVAGITLISKGARYATTPRVHIRGGGGQGAKAVATLGGATVSTVTITDGGSGYLTPAAVTLNNGGSSKTASAQVIVAHGQVVAIDVTAGGAGYQRVPTVSIKGGRTASGRDATATAELFNGRIVHFTILDGGAGYVQPLTVTIDPGEGTRNAIPIWAPAGALTTTLSDLAKFADAALLAGHPHGLVPRSVADGFTIAETPYACTGSNPDLATCPAGTPQSALAWQVLPADAADGVPTVITKDGSLAGFTTFVALMPDAGLAVVVMANSRSPESGSNTTEPAPNLANNILYAIYEACQSGRCPH